MILKLIRDKIGIPIFQYLKRDGSEFEAVKGANGAIDVNASIVGSLANDFEQLTVDATEGGVALTPAKYGINTKAYITVETAPIRFCIDGSAPTATLGHLLNIGDLLELSSADDIAHLKAIRTTGVSAVINCTYST